MTQWGWRWRGPAGSPCDAFTNQGRNVPESAVARKGRSQTPVLPGELQRQLPPRRVWAGCVGWTQTERPFCIHRVDVRTCDVAQLYEQLSHKLLLATLVILRLTRLNAKYCGPLKKRKKAVRKTRIQVSSQLSALTEFSPNKPNRLIQRSKCAILRI